MGHPLGHLALPKSEGTGHLAHRGKAQNAFAVISAFGSGSGADGGFVTGKFHVLLKLAERQPRQRVPPVQAGGQIVQRLGNGVTPADVGAFMQQYRTAWGTLQALRHINAGAQHAKCERRGNRGAGVAAIRRFAGKGYHAAQAAIASRRTHQ